MNVHILVTIGTDSETLLARRINAPEFRNSKDLNMQVVNGLSVNVLSEKIEHFVKATINSFKEE